jgi:hypothetical protein
MGKTRQKIIGMSVVALAAISILGGAAGSASAAVTITRAYPSQAACLAGEEYYVETHWRITSGCQWYFIERTDPNSWMFSATR